MNNSRTGCRAAAADNVSEALGTMRGKVYVAPNGRKFRRGSTPVVAGILLAAQPRMARLKEVIATSTREMVRDYPESELTNWFVDELMRAVADSTGRAVDVGIVNFGGIRVDMPAGNVTLDDIQSMFPFKNKPCYVAMPGSELQEILQNMAATRFQVLGGPGRQAGKRAHRWETAGCEEGLRGGYHRLPAEWWRRSPTGPKCEGFGHPGQLCN